jgi:hypothetical protein
MLNTLPHAVSTQRMQHSKTCVNGLRCDSPRKVPKARLMRLLAPARLRKSLISICICTAAVVRAFTMKPEVLELISRDLSAHIKAPYTAKFSSSTFIYTVQCLHAH